MTHRKNWKVLATSDPIPGNVRAIRDAGEHYNRIQQALATARDRLDDVITGNFRDEMISEAVDQIRSEARTVRNGVDGIRGRYTVVARELNDFATKLDILQEEANQAEGAAQNAQNAIDAAKKDVASHKETLSDLRRIKHAYDHYSGDEDHAPSPQSVRQNQESISHYQSLLENCEADLERAKQAKKDAAEKLAKAIKDWDKAAANAVDAINRVIKEDGQSDSWWDNWGSKLMDFVLSVPRGIVQAVADLIQGIKGAIQAAFEMLSAVYDYLTGAIDYDTFKQRLDAAYEHLMEALVPLLSALGTILSFVAAVVAFIPGGQIVAMALGIVGSLLTLGSVLIETSLAIKRGMASGEWDRAARLGVDVSATNVSGIAGQVAESVAKRVGPKALGGPVGGAVTVVVELCLDMPKHWSNDALGISPKGLAKGFNPHFSRTDRNEAFTDWDSRNVVDTVMSQVDKPCISFTVPSIGVPQMPRIVPPNVPYMPRVSPPSVPYMPRVSPQNNDQRAYVG